MRAIEATGMINESGQISLDKPLEITLETAEDPDDESIESVKASLRRSLAEAKEGKRLPIAQLWSEIDAD